MIYSRSSILGCADYSNLLTMYKSRALNLDLLKNSPTLQDTGMKRIAKVVKVAPKEDEFMYVRVRAVSAGNVIEHEDGSCEVIPMDEFFQDLLKYWPICRGPNDNFDFFPVDELKKQYRTFIGKAIFINHDDEDVSKARGMIIDAHYNNDKHFVEILMAVDKAAYPQLGKAIEKGLITETSMGCHVKSAECSICHHMSYNDDDLCEHVKYHKGGYISGVPVFEVEHTPIFFEQSLLENEPPADINAHILERVASIRKPVSYKINHTDVNSEKNQRFMNGRVQTLADKLSQLPWSN